MKFLLIFLLAGNALAFSFSSGGGSTVNAFHADNLDNGTGTNAFLEGAFHGNLQGNILADYNQSVTIQAGGENGESGGVGGSVNIFPAVGNTRMSVGNLNVLLGYNEGGIGAFNVNSTLGNIFTANGESVYFGVPISGDGSGLTNLPSHFNSFVGIGTTNPLVPLQVELVGPILNNEGNPRFLMNVDANKNPSIELQTGTGTNRGFAAFIDFCTEENSDYDARIIKFQGSPLDIGDATGVVTIQGAEFRSDTGENGGTTIGLKASDDGSQMYLHITSAGVITATSSP